MSTAAIAGPVRANEHRRLAWGRILAWVVMGAIMLITLFPLYWILRTALSSNSSLYGGATSWLPTDWNTGSFARVFGIQAGKEALAEGGSGQSIDFWRYLGNSIVVDSSVVTDVSFDLSGAGKLLAFITIVTVIIPIGEFLGARRKHLEAVASKEDVDAFADMYC